MGATSRAADRHQGNDDRRLILDRSYARIKMLSNRKYNIDADEYKPAIRGYSYFG